MNEITLPNKTVTDLSLEEHVFKQTPSEAIDYRSINILKEEAPVVLFTATGKKIPGSISVSQDYEKLKFCIKGNEKTIKTSDIKEISQSFMIQVQREEDNLYTIKIKAKGKLYLMAFFSKETRQKWSNGLECLIKAIQIFQRQDCFKVFCDLIINNLENSGKITTLNENRLKQLEKLNTLQSKSNDLDLISIKTALEELITLVEVMMIQEKIEETWFQVENLESEKTLLNKNKSLILKSINKKTEEIDLLRESLQSFKEHLKILDPKAKTEFFFSSFWLRILNFLSFQDLFEIQKVSKKFSSIFILITKNKSIWPNQTKFSLEPRDKSWNLYINNFIRPIFKIPESKSLDLHLFRKYPGLLSKICTLPQGIQEICLEICESFNITTCFEELSKITTYIYSVVQEESKTFEILYSISNPPYYLVEIWKPGLIRLRLGIFQVQKLLKLRHPYLYKHFKSIDISIDYIITPWIASVFTCYFRSNQDNLALGLLWDQFVTKGWHGIITCCLVLLFSSQSKVIGESLESTLSYYKLKLNFKEISSVLQNYWVETGFLNELENFFYFSMEN